MKQTIRHKLFLLSGTKENYTFSWEQKDSAYEAKFEWPVNSVTITKTYPGHAPWNLVAAVFRPVDGTFPFPPLTAKEEARAVLLKRIEQATLDDVTECLAAVMREISAGEYDNLVEGWAVQTEEELQAFISKWNT